MNASSAPLLKVDQEGRVRFSERWDFSFESTYCGFMYVRLKLPRTITIMALQY